MKVLRVGDPHIKPTNIDEAEKLMHFVHDTILAEKPDRVEILGDLFHTHAIVRLEVLEFWDGWIDVFASHEDVEFFILVGNHDMATNQEFASHAMLPFKRLRNRNIHIVDLPQTHGLFSYVPYYHDNATFIDVANRSLLLGAKVLVCHQTFDGSRYESGTYAPDGIDPSKVDAKLIISGHIHSRQVIVNGDQTIIYPGTPKWDTLSDANEDKGIWLYEHDDTTGAIISEQILRTAHVVTKLVKITWKEGEDMEDMEAIPSGCKVAVELIGSSDWVSKNKIALKTQGIAISTKITDRVDKSARQVGVDFLDFVKNLYLPTMDREHLLLRMKEMGIVGH